MLSYLDHVGTIHLKGMGTRRSAAAVVPPTKPGWLIGAVPCKIGAPVTGFVLAQGTHQTGFEIAEYRRLWLGPRDTLVAHLQVDTF